MICQICGCSEDNACVDVGGDRAFALDRDVVTCAWFVPFLCDFCVLGVRAPAAWDRVPSYFVDLELL
jgi:hypothetical protein